MTVPVPTDPAPTPRHPEPGISRDINSLTEAELAAVVAHSNRFRRVADRYPLQVTYAYGGDIARAAADSDAEVAATVAAWEVSQGLIPRDWMAIGRSQRDES